MQMQCCTQCWFGSGSHYGSSQKFQLPSLAWSPSCCSRTPALPSAGPQAAIAALNQAQHLVLLLLPSEVLQFLQRLT